MEVNINWFMKHLTLWMLAAILLFCGSHTAMAQSAINDIPAEVNAADATIGYTSQLSEADCLIF